MGGVVVVGIGGRGVRWCGQGAGKGNNINGRRSNVKCQIEKQILYKKERNGMSKLSLQKFFTKTNENTQIISLPSSSSSHPSPLPFPSSTQAFFPKDANIQYLDNQELPVYFSSDDELMKILYQTDERDIPDIFPPSQIMVNLCIFQVDKWCCSKPFVKYFFVKNSETSKSKSKSKSEKSEKTKTESTESESTEKTKTEKNNKKKRAFVFPNISVDCSHLRFLQGDKLEEELHSAIINEPIAFYLDLFEMHDSFHEEMFQEIFKGFIVKNKEVYIFIEHKPLSLSLKNRDMKWAIFDEILCLKKINGTKIHSNIVELFSENEYLTSLQMNEMPVEMPHLLYMCKSEDPPHFKNLKNVLKTDFGKSGGNGGEIETTIDHPFFGDFFYFSSHPLTNPTQNSPNTHIRISELQRYVVFTNVYFPPDDNSESYITRDFSEISEEQKQLYLKNNENYDINTVFFKEKNVAYWCIRSLGQFCKI